MKKLQKSQIQNLPEFDNHESVFEISKKDSGLQGFIAIHKKNKDKPSFGATRFWTYSTKEDALRDSLRLSKMMSYKSALAGLPYGGAKGVLIKPVPLKKSQRKIVLKAYSAEVNKLKGAFITGTDVGLYKKDVRFMKKYSPYMVGTQTNPTKFTALGLFLAIKTCLKEKFGDEEIKGHSFAIQGVGKIGKALVQLLYPHTQDIFVSDVNEKRIVSLKKSFPKIKVVKSEALHKQNVDVFSPCALSRSLTSRTIGELRCKIVAGGANNQLESEEAGDFLYKQGILYAPDYVINAGGLLSVVDEYENAQYNEERITERIATIPQTLQNIFKETEKYSVSPHRIADRIAKKKLKEY